MTRSRTPLRATLAAVVATVLAVGLAPGLARAEPTAEEAERQLDKLGDQLAVVVEQYNDLRVTITDTRAKAAKLTQQLAPMQAKVDELHRKIGKFSAAAYKGSKASAVNAILESGSPSTMADQLLMLDRIAAGNNHEIDKLNDAKSTLDEEKSKLDELLAQQSKAERDLNNKKQYLEKEMKRVDDLRKAAHREAGNTDDGEPPPYIPGALGKVVSFAYDQLGKPYVYGADGPGSFDCSGLTLRAYSQVGVSLPHSSRSQYSRATKVSRSSLKPGYLVWFYSDRHHVGIYIGNNTVIHAPKPGDHVKKTKIDYMPYNGAGRFTSG